MAPRRPSAKQASKAKRKKRANPAAPSTRKLLLDAEAAMTEGDIQTALALTGHALATLDGPSTSENPTDESSTLLSPLSDNPYTGAAHTLMGNLVLEATGDPDNARPYFLAAVKADPEADLPDDQGGGADKFLYLAQLSDAGGKDSVAWFDRGVKALRKKIGILEESRDRAQARQKQQADATGRQVAASESSESAREEIAALRHKLAEVLCAVVEVYMTDLSFEADAESICEALVTEAVALVEIDSSSEASKQGSGSPNDAASAYSACAASVWQTLASVRVSQNRAEEARSAVIRSFEGWEGLPPEDPRVPAFAVRVSLVRLLLTTGMVERAAEVAARLRDEDDTAVEVWYLGGWALYLQGEALKAGGELENWKGYWVKARRWLSGCLRVFNKLEYEDDRLKEHVDDLLKEVVEGVGEAEGSEDEWEDDEDGDEESSESGEDDDEEMQS